MGRAPGCDAADYEDASSRAAALGCAQDLAVLIEVVGLPGEVLQKDGQGNVHLRPPAGLVVADRQVQPSAPSLSRPAQFGSDKRLRYRPVLP